MTRTFRSDNNAGMCPEALDALADASRAGHAIGYGDDDATAAAASAFVDLFGAGTRIFFVATGTAANTLAVASLTRPWQRVLCHRHSHWNDDESTAPERFTGCRTTAVDPHGGDGSKLSPEDVRRAGAASRGDVHQPSPGALTISNPTEFGTLYTPEELRALCDAAHELGYRVHIDGARFANAVARLIETRGGSARDHARALTVDAGADSLSFGGTKNGLAFGEAALFFPQGDGGVCQSAAEAFPHLRKSSGHLLSKHRFISAPLARTLKDGSWIRHAAHANAMASRLAEGLADTGIEIRFPAQTNSVFPTLPETLRDALWAKGHRFYPFGDPAWRVARLMCSFDTTPEDVDGLLEDARDALRDAM